MANVTFLTRHVSHKQGELPVAMRLRVLLLSSALGVLSACTFSPPGTVPHSPEPDTANAITRSVYLTWNASSQAIGYRVYRSGRPGGPYELLTPVIVAASMYVDFVTSGRRYFYVVTAVDGVGLESLPSKEVGPVE